MNDRRILMACHRTGARYRDGGGQAEQTFTALVIACQLSGQLAPGVDTPAQRQQLACATSLLMLVREMPAATSSAPVAIPAKRRDSGSRAMLT